MPRHVGVPNVDPSWVCTLCLGGGEGEAIPESRLGERGFRDQLVPPQCRSALRCVSLFPPPGLPGRPHRHPATTASRACCTSGLFSLLAALAFSIMICLGPGLGSTVPPGGLLGKGAGGSTLQLAGLDNLGWRRAAGGLGSQPQQAGWILLQYP